MAERAHALYAYCVLPTGERPRFGDAAGVGAGIELVEHGPLSAAVTTVALDEFGSDALRRNLEDMAWLERTARAHEEVLAQALAAEAVVPMRLCTIFTDEAQVRQMLERERESLLGALERVRGHAEWSVKVMADPRAAEEAARGGAGEGAPSGEAPGRAYLARKQRERSLREEAHALIDAAAEDIHARLVREAAAAAVLAPQRPELSGRSGLMVLNGAYLVARERAGAFAAVVEELRGRHRQLGFEIELAGPWAPYNFVAEARPAA